MSKENKLATAWLWYKQTSTLLGIPILMLLLFMGLQKFVFTTTCQTAGYKCEYALGNTEGIHQYITSLLQANPDRDLVFKER